MNIVSIRTISSRKSQQFWSMNSCLYHASQVNGLSKILPKRKTLRHPKEGKLIFATPDEAYASCFLVSTDDSWVLIGLLNNIHYIVISDKRKFLNLDKGGTIYELPSDGFNCDLTKSGREKEWVSKVPARPVRSVFYSKALNAMMEFGVQVFFVDKKAFNRIKNSLEFGQPVLRELKSENERLGINIRHF